MNGKIDETQKQPCTFASNGSLSSKLAEATGEGQFKGLVRWRFQSHLNHELPETSQIQKDAGASVCQKPSWTTQIWDAFNPGFISLGWSVRVRPKKILCHLSGPQMKQDPGLPFYKPPQKLPRANGTSVSMEDSWLLLLRDRFSIAICTTEKMYSNHKRWISCDFMWYHVISCWRDVPWVYEPNYKWIESHHFQKFGKIYSRQPSPAGTEQRAAEWVRSFKKSRGILRCANDVRNATSIYPCFTAENHDELVNFSMSKPQMTIFMW